MRKLTTLAAQRFFQAIGTIGSEPVRSRLLSGQEASCTVCRRRLKRGNVIPSFKARFCTKPNLLGALTSGGPGGAAPLPSRRKID